ncbi:tyrosine-type recombinase/integrase [Flaviflexus massiliensis]|uniref:tyrosine-type recombinase/integrase n=1 Tax=Flaviflexus massiliensis TaxID=1522309 RepID=UPI0006D56F14|nr:site-specific integrase [Flaviflexus massiliensis]
MARRSDFGSILTTQSGRYRGRYRRRGKDYYTPLRPSRRLVGQDLTKIHASILDGTWEPPRGTIKRPTLSLDETATIEEWYEHWYGQMEKAGRSPNSLRGYGSIFRRRILPTLGHIELGELTAEDCRDLYVTLQESLSIVSAQNTIRSLSACMGAAVDAGLLASNPVQVKGAMAKPRARTDFPMLEVEQIARLIDATEGKYKAAVTLGVWCQLRISEVRALTREDVKLAPLRVSVSKAVKRGPTGALTVGPPKSEAGRREISVPAVMHEVLLHHLEVYVPPAPGSLLFHNRDRLDGIVSDKVLLRALNLATEAAGLPRLRFHDLRHIGLTHYGRQGATLADLKFRAGHSSVEAVQIYQHSSKQRDAELAARLGS